MLKSIILAIFHNYQPPAKSIRVFADIMQSTKKALVADFKLLAHTVITEVTSVHPI